jgi:hypothetical protein
MRMLPFTWLGKHARRPPYARSPILRSPQKAIGNGSSTGTRMSRRMRYLKDLVRRPSTGRSGNPALSSPERATHTESSTRPPRFPAWRPHSTCHDQVFLPLIPINQPPTRLFCQFYPDSIQRSRIPQNAVATTVMVSLLVDAHGPTLHSRLSLLQSPRD